MNTTREKTVKPRDFRVGPNSHFWASRGINGELFRFHITPDQNGAVKWLDIAAKNKTDGSVSAQANQLLFDQLIKINIQYHSIYLEL